MSRCVLAMTDGNGSSAHIGEAAPSVLLLSVVLKSVQVNANVPRLGVLTVSDKGSQGQRQDESGPAIEKVLSPLSYTRVKYEIVPDERDIIADRLRRWADSGEVDLIVTTGGTGLALRDVTPEATLDVVDKLVPGLAEVMRADSLKQTPMAMLSRAVAGIRGCCLIINLPGSPRAVRQCLEAVKPALPHAMEILLGQAGECATRFARET